MSAKTNRSRSCTPLSRAPSNSHVTTEMEHRAFLDYETLPQTPWTTTPTRPNKRPWTALTTRSVGYTPERPKTAQEKSKERLEKFNRLDEFYRDHFPSIYNNEPRELYTVRWRPQFSRESTNLSTMMETRRVSPQTEQKIVHHLRKKLNRRMEARVQKLLSTVHTGTRQTTAQTGGGGSRRASAAHTPAPPPDPKDRYNEFGENLAMVNQYRDRTGDMGQPQGILSKPGSVRRRRSVTLNLPTSRRNSAVRRISQQESVASLELNVAVSTDSESEEDYANMRDVSPVPTPLIYRPRTREDSRCLRMTLEQKVEAIAKGAVHIKPPGDSRIIRVYIGSAFSDSAEDRLHMLETVYQDMKLYCSLRQYELQLYDLHLGVKDWITDDHTATEMALELLEKCVDGSRSLSFVTFISQKYGPPVLPTVIPKDEFDVINKTVVEEFAKQKLISLARRTSQAAAEEEDASPEPQAKTKPSKRRATRMLQSIVKRRESKIKNVAEKISPDVFDINLLATWYKLDENVVPPAYRLQKISSQIPDILRNDASKRQQARNVWTVTQNKLQRMLQAVVNMKPDQIFDKKKYFCSVVDLEIEYALLAADRPKEQILWYERTITDLKHYLHSEEAKFYADLMPMDPKFDPAIAERLEQTKNKLRDALGERSVHDFEVHWEKNGVTRQSRDQVKVMERMSRDFKQTVAQRVDKLIVDEKLRNSGQSRVYEDVVHHATFCQKQCESFHGRKDVLTQVKRYIRSKSRSPFIVHGIPGSGKSSLMARVAKDLKKWYSSDKTVSVVVRIIGVTADSRNIRHLLYSLCTQLALIHGDDINQVPHDYRGLINDLSARLSQAKSDNPIIVLLDGLDQLTDAHLARQLSWLPKDLPKYCKLIVSTLPGESYGVFPKLKTLFPGPENYVTVDKMHESEAMIILDHWLQKDHRSLTQFQYDKVIEAFIKCPVPLYLKLVYNNSLEWHSYTDEERIKLQGSVKNEILGLFTRLEAKHGEPLVRRALGYFTAAKNGITQNEIEDLLSLDDAVMDDLDKMMPLKNRRCPTIAWMRLRMDLNDYLVERKTDGCAPMQWFHPQFREAATERYLNQKDRAPSYHKAIAEYFMDMWAEGKPIGNTERKVNRFIAKQPNFHTIPMNEGEKIIYNRRKFSELPYNLLKAASFKDMKKNCLCNFQWLLAKITASGITETLDDFTMALGVEPDDTDLKLLAHALYLSYNVLEKDPSQLPTQLVGRLQDLISSDVPATAQDPKKYPALHPLLKQAKRSELPCLIPSVTCLTPPDGTMFDLLSGHKKGITAVTMTADGLQGITTSKDDTMKIWDLKSGRVTKTIKNVGVNVLALRTASKNTMIVSSEKSLIRIWSVETGDCVYTIDGYEDPASITLASEGTVLAAYYDGSFLLRSFALEPEVKLLAEVDLANYSNGYPQDESIAVSYHTNGPQVLAALRGSNLGLVHNVTSGNLIHELKANSGGALVNHAGTSRDYFILGTRSMVSNIQESYQLELFDITNGKPVRILRGCAGDNSKLLLINKLGSHALSVCGSVQNNTSTIAIWNLETEEHKHLAQHCAVSTMGACSDFNFVLTGSRGENSLRIWNLLKANQNVAKVAEKSGIKMLHVMSEHSQYAIAESFEKGTVFITNLCKDKYRGKPVMKEVNLVSSQDVVLFRDHYAVILSDRCNSTVTEDNQQVFQTVTRFNMKTRKYESKIKDCFIFPSPSHEFKILSDFRLLGLSENRSHFIIWNTHNGHILYRIKPNKKAMVGELGLSDLSLSPLPKVDDRAATSMMTQWDRRNESHTARQRRKMAEQDIERQRLDDLKREKENAIDQYLISKDETTILASFYAHHICVFDVETQTHLGVLEDEHSMLFLHNSAITRDGKYLVLTNYDEQAKLSFVTMWNCQTFQVRKRLRNEKNVCALALNDKADRVVFGKEGAGMRIWDPHHEKSLRKIPAYKGMTFGVNSRIHLIDEGKRAAVFAGDISLWDLDKAELLSVFTPDMRIQCFELGLGGELLVFGLRDTDRVIALRLSKGYTENRKAIKPEDIFGEAAESSESEDDEDEQ